MTTCFAATTAHTAPEPLLVTDLLQTGTDLAGLLTSAVSDQQWCDAFLLSAGLLQLADDALHPDPLQLRRAASHLGSRASLPARAAGVGATACAGALALRQRTAPTRRLLAARPALADLSSVLASAVLDPDAIVDPGAVLDPGATTGGSGLDALVRQAVAAAPLLGADVTRLPACFRDFDLHPDDVQGLAGQLRERHGIRRGPVCVIGVRTSGCYLAPLLAAALERQGASEVVVLTHRPARPFLQWERRALRRTARAGGRVVVIDDPPATGRSLGATLKAIAAAGVPVEATTLALPLFIDEEELPARLQGYAAAVAPWPSWSLHARLEGSSVAATLSDLLGGDWGVDRCERRPDEPAATGAGRRDHTRARYAVQLTNRGTGLTEQRELLVEGAGLGYLGGHALAVAQALPDHLPAVHGLVDGLLYRQWLPEPRVPVGEQTLAAAITAYVADRQQALPARADPTRHMRGREPVWEVAAELLSRPYGWAAPATRGLLESVTRRLLVPRHLSVVDGETSPSRWLPDPGQPGHLRKVGFHQRAFGHWGVSSYDAVFDLAGAACDPLSPGFTALLRDGYEAATGERVDEERWLLYRLAQLWRLGRAGDLGPDAVGRHSAAAVHDFLAACYLDDLSAPDGPMCAIDLDGVLETDRLGYPCMTPIAMLALRALTAHGYRIVLATGRGIDEVRDRCARLRLAGAVPEYGTAVHTCADGVTTDLRSEHERVLLDAVRAQLAGRGALLAPTHSYAVRARLRGGPLPADLVADVPLLSDPALRLVHGDSQTDVTVSRLDKRTGLAVLADALGATGAAFAVGDTAADLTMLGWAQMARAPRNADAAVASAVPVTRHAYQSGLSDACADLLGHRPGHCPVCRAPDLPARTRDLLALLSLSEAGVRGLPLRTARVALRAARVALPGAGVTGAMVKGSAPA